MKSQHRTKALAPALQLELLIYTMDESIISQDYPNSFYQKNVGSSQWQMPLEIDYNELSGGEDTTELLDRYFKSPEELD